MYNKYVNKKQKEVNMLFFLMSLTAGAKDYKVSNTWDYNQIQVTICKDSNFDPNDIVNAINFWESENHAGHKNISKNIVIAEANDPSCQKRWKYGHILIAGPRDLNTNLYHGKCKYWHSGSNGKIVSAFVRIDPNSNELKDTLYHEFGHALGLAHNHTDPNNLMYVASYR